MLGSLNVFLTRHAPQRLNQILQTLGVGHLHRFCGTFKAECQGINLLRLIFIISPVTMLCLSKLLTRRRGAVLPRLFPSSNVSRCERLQDGDESAYYEFISDVVYCAELVESEGGLMANIGRRLKRATRR